jgi:hypothetical protein
MYDDIYGARVSSDGEVLDPWGFCISSAIYGQRNPTVAYNGTCYLVAWHDERISWQYDIFAARVSKDGELLDSNGIQVCAAQRTQQYPSATSDGVNWLVVWEDYRVVSTYAVYGARVGPTGAVLDSGGFRITSSPNSTPRRYPVARWVAPNYIVAWEDWRRQTESDIWAAHVSPLGAVMDTYALVTQPGNQNSIDLAADTAGHFLAVYSGWTSAFNGLHYDATRVWGLVAPATGVAEELSPPAVIGSELELSPNPCHGVLYIRARPGAGPAERVVCVHDVAGRLVRRVGLDVSTCGEVSLRDLPDGIYFVSIPTRTADRSSQSRFKVVLSR